MLYLWAHIGEDATLITRICQSYVSLKKTIMITIVIQVLKNMKLLAQ
jgi:hypothetical protein